MNKSTSTQKYKFKKYKKCKKTFEYALLFANSNAMVDFICSMPVVGICESSLYTKNGEYQLITVCERELKNPKCTAYCDKNHINDIKQNNRLICKNSAVQKIKKSFKEI